MDDSHREAFEKLEEAVTQWGAQVSGSQDGLAEELTRARGKLDAVGGDLATAARLPALLRELREGMDALHVLLAQQTDRQPASDQNELRTVVEGLRGEVQGLRHDLDDVRERLAESTKRLANLPAEASAVSGATRETTPAAGLHHDTWLEVARLRAQLEDETSSSTTPEDLSGIEFLAYDSEGRRRRIGEILRSAGFLDDSQVDQALAEQVQAPYRRLGSILVEKGFAPEEVVARVLAGQLRTRFVRLATENIDPAAVPLVSARMARQHTCLPIAATEDRLTLALANPFDLVAIDDVEMASQRRVDTVVATAPDIEAAIQRFHGA